MSTVAAETPDVAPPAGGKKKKIIIITVAVLALAGGGTGAFFMLKGKPAEVTAEGKAGARADGGAKGDDKAAQKRDPKVKPTFIPLESFTVNLADKENERYAQVVFSIEAADSATGDAIKAHLPAIRGRVLMTLSSKSAADLGGREGKVMLAKEILADARKAMDLPETSQALVDVHFSHFVMQ